MTEKEIQVIEELYEIYIYAFPLVVLDLHFTALTNTEYPTDKKAPINQYIHAKDVAKADDREIIHPNIDTVYSKAHMNLKEGPLFFHKPAADRYTAAEIIDAYGNCIAVVGNGGIGGDAAVDAVLVGPDYTGPVPDGLARIDIPTNLCWTLTRILKTAEDETNIKRIQQGFDIRPLSAWQKEYKAPRGTYSPDNDFIPAEKLETLTIEEFFSIFNRLIVDNMGKTPDKRILENAEKYKIGPGQIFTLSPFSSEICQEMEGFYTRAVTEFNWKIKNHVYSPMRGHWIWTNPETANFKSDYSLRAKVAWSGFGAMPIHIAIYPSTFTDCEGRPLDGKYRYRCHFDSLPPVREFWSLTAYGDDLFLIPNELNRNGINDRSSWQTNLDGSLDLYIQREKPSEGKIDRWLPVGEAGFGLVLRLYSPEETILSGAWKLPEIERVSE